VIIQIKAAEQYSPVVLFITLYNIVPVVTIQVKALE